MRLVELTAILVIAATALPGTTAAPDRCGAIRQRREIRNLSDAERQAYINSIRRLQTAKQPNTYDRFSQIHYDARDTAHGYAWFFSWHRAYLRSFEKELQKLDSNIMLPYWNWAYDSQAPELSPVFGPSWFGGNGRSGDQCVTNGPFANWRPYYPQPHCLPRSWDNGNRMSAFASPEALESISNGATTYERFFNDIEGWPHGQVHVAIGGDMGIMYSPNDPLFYLHHAFVDKIWADWQKKSGNARKYDGSNADGSPARVTDILSPFGYSVNDVLDTRSLCYTYAPFQSPPPRPAVASSSFVGSGNNTNSSAAIVVTPIASNATRSTEAPAPPSADDRKELIALRSPKPLPEAWILSNHQKVENVRRVESNVRSIVSRLNSVPGYVSPAAPLRQPAVLASFASTQSELTATKAGRKVAVQVRTNRVTDENVQNVISQVNNRLGTLPSPSANQNIAAVLGGNGDASADQAA